MGGEASSMTSLLLLPAATRGAAVQALAAARAAASWTARGPHRMMSEPPLIWDARLACQGASHMQLQLCASSIVICCCCRWAHGRHRLRPAWPGRPRHAAAQRRHEPVPAQRQGNPAAPRLSAHHASLCCSYSLPACRQLPLCQRELAALFSLTPSYRPFAPPPLALLVESETPSPSASCRDIMAHPFAPAPPLACSAAHASRSPCPPQSTDPDTIITQVESHSGPDLFRPDYRRHAFEAAEFPMAMRQANVAETADRKAHARY